MVKCYNCGKHNGALVPSDRHRINFCKDCTIVSLKEEIADRDERLNAYSLRLKDLKDKIRHLLNII